MNYLFSISGDYTVGYFIGFLEVLSLSLYLFVLGRRHGKRSLFPLRFAVCLALSLALCLPLSAVREELESPLGRVIFDCGLLCALFATVFVCYSGSVSGLLLLYSSAVVIKNISGTVIPLLRNLFGRSDLDSISFFSDYVPWRDWSIYVLLQIALLAAADRLFRRAEKRSPEPIELNGAVLLTVSVFLIRGVIHPVARNYQHMSFELAVCVKLLMLVIYLLFIAIRAGMLSRTRILRELGMTEELLSQEKKRYTDMRDSIEVVNMKVHDIRHMLTRLQGKLTEEELRALSEAVEIYDSNINTGSKILDTVLYQKKLYCDSHGIRLDWAAQGDCLSFITPSKLYALISNALENAVEAVSDLPEPKRIITFSVRSTETGAVIEVSNYFDASARPVSGTSKADKVHHGFGIKSMRYVAEEYGGSVETFTEDDMFFLTVTLNNE